MSELSDDYLLIASQLLNDYRQWENIPEIVCLTMKAIAQFLENHDKKINQQQIAIKHAIIKNQQINYFLQQKVNKKQMKQFIQQLLMRKDNSRIQQSMMPSRYSESINENIGLDKVMIQEVKTIVEHHNKIQFQLNRFEKQNDTLSQQIRQQHQMIQIYAKKITQLQSNENIYEEKVERQIKKIQFNFEEQIINLNTNLRQVSENIINQVYENYFRKQTIIQHYQQLKYQLINKFTNEKNIKNKQTAINESNKFELEKNNKQLQMFKYKIMKDMTMFAKIQQVQTIINTYQSEIMQKWNNNTDIVNKLDFKIKNILKQIDKKQDNKTQRKKINHSPSKSTKQITDNLNKIDKTLKQKFMQMKKIQKNFTNKIQKCEKKFEEQMDRRDRHLCELIQNNNLLKNGEINQKREMKPIQQSLHRIYQQMIIVRLLYFGEIQCKAKQMICWDKQAVNMMQQLFIWKKGQNYIGIQASGLYKIQVGLYEDIAEVEAQLILNGQVIGVLKNQKTIKTQQNEIKSSVKRRGYIFNEPIIIPASSMLSIRLIKSFYGQAYLQVQKM